MCVGDVSPVTVSSFGWRCLCVVVFWGVYVVCRVEVRWFGWNLSIEWWREYVMCSVSLTHGIFMSMWIVVFPYHGASITILFWSVSTLCNRVFDAEIHMALPDRHNTCYVNQVSRCLWLRLKFVRSVSQGFDWFKMVWRAVLKLSFHSATETLTAQSTTY